MRKGRSQKMGTAFSHGRESRGPKPFGPGAGWQRLRGCKGRPCPESRGGAFWAGGRVAAPAGCAEGSALARVQRQSLWPSEVLKAQRPQGGSTLRTGYYLPKITGGTGKRNPPKQREGIPVPALTTKNERRHSLSQERIPAYHATTDAPASTASTTPNTTTAAST